MSYTSNFIDALEEFKKVFPYVNVEYNDNYWNVDDNEESLMVEPIGDWSNGEIDWNYGFETKAGSVRADGYFIINVDDGSGGEFTMILNEAKEVKEETV